MPFVVMLDRKDGSALIVCGESNNLCTEGQGFNSAREAAVYRAALAALHPDNSYTVKEWGVRDRDWRLREYNRIIYGQYIKVPWWGEPWCVQYDHTGTDRAHFEHMSQKSIGLVSFTENADKGELDRQAPAMAPGRFLKRFYGDVLSDEDIERWVARCSELTGDIELQVTQDADVIEEIYVHGPGSCMAHPASSFDSPVHPARVYAGPDLAVAWLGDSDDASARCVIWPEKKLHSTIYGDVSRMTLALKAAGYTKGSLDGARIQRIQYSGGFVMPYVDGSDDAGDESDFLRLGGGYLHVHNTNGLTQEGCCCDDCDDYVGENEIVWIEYHERSVCKCCLSANYTYSGYVRSYVADDQLTEVSGGSHGWCPTNRLSDFDFVEITSGSHVGEVWHLDHAFLCEDCDEWFHTDDRAEDDHDTDTICSGCLTAREEAREDDNDEAEDEEAAAVASDPAPVGDTLVVEATREQVRAELHSGVPGQGAGYDYGWFRQQMFADTLVIRQARNFMVLSC